MVYQSVVGLVVPSGAVDQLIEEGSRVVYRDILIDWILPLSGDRQVCIRYKPTRATSLY